MHSTECRFIKGPLNVLFEGVRVCPYFIFVFQDTRSLVYNSFIQVMDDLYTEKLTFTLLLQCRCAWTR